MLYVPPWIVTLTPSSSWTCLSPTNGYCLSSKNNILHPFIAAFVNSMLSCCRSSLRTFVVFLCSSKLSLVLIFLFTVSLLPLVGGATPLTTSATTTTSVNSSSTTTSSTGVFGFQRCIESPGYAWRRRFSYDNRNYPLRIEVTDRPSHRIVSHILAIILFETLLYEEVTFVEQDWDSPYKVLNRLSCTNHNKSGCIDKSAPASFINLEVWMPPGFNVEAWVNRGDVIDGGALGPVAYLGIFTPKTTVLRVLNATGITLDHYRALQFKRFREQLLEVSLRANKSLVGSKSLYNQCEESTAYDYCFPLYIDRKEFLEPLKKLLAEVFTIPTFNVILVPRSVNLTYPSSTYSNQSEFVIEFFAHWYPSEVTVRNEFTRILLPDSYTSNSRIVEENTSGSNPGNFDMYQLTRVMWSEIKQHATHAYHLIKAMVFSHGEYENFLRSVNVQLTNSKEKERDYNLIACQWVRDNLKKMKAWTPNALQKEKLIIGGMFPTHGKFKVPELDIVANQTVTKMNKELMNTSQYEFSLEIEGLSCDQESVLSAYLKYVHSCQSGRPMVGVIAALCSNALEPMMKLTNLQRRIVISPTADSVKYLRGSQPNYFFRTIPSMRYYNDLIISVFRRYKWKRLALFRKDDDFIDRRILGEELEVVEDVELPEDRFSYEVVYNHLSDAKKKHIRLFIVEYFSNNTNLLICAAAKLNMTHENGYVWFFNWWLPSKWFDRAVHNCTADEMVSVAEMHLILKPQMLNTDQGSEKPPPPPKRIDSGVVKPTKKPPGSAGEQYLTGHYSPYTKDAVVALARAVSSLLKDSPWAVSALTSPEIADALSRKLREASVISLGHGTVRRQVVSFNDQNEREAGLWSLLQYRKRFYVPILSWQRNSTQGVNGTAVIQKGNVLWINTASLRSTMFDGEKISDGTEFSRSSIYDGCLLGSTLPQKMGMSCDSATVVFYGGVAIIVVAFVGGIFGYLKRKQRRAGDENKRPFLELCEELQYLDVPVENIVTNHEIGYGAFGRVFGGEMKHKGSKEWISVAVKVTNRECSYERKRELLEEARLMSKLNHPHVLKLYGICLHPPEDNFIYLLMEYMRLLDLKSYLLSRRPLCLRNPSDKEVSPETLTNFAIDIANGLEYMHNNNLIHRDLACRNCLVNDELERCIVKIGDFGMTREMRTDQPDRYYKLGKNIELPVRWMSPESINFGRHDIPGDIWSYGVVLFEMVTFGEFPMLNYPDESVSDLVKRNQLSVLDCLPDSAYNTKVYGLIKWCCQFNASDRPASMLEVMDELKTDPQFIRAYLTPDPPKPLAPVINALPTGAGTKHGGGGGAGGGATNRHGEKSNQVRNISIDSNIVPPRRSSTQHMLSASTHLCNGNMANDPLDLVHNLVDPPKTRAAISTSATKSPPSPSPRRNFGSPLSCSSTPRAGGGGPSVLSSAAPGVHPANKSFSTEYVSSLQARLTESSAIAKDYDVERVTSEESSGDNSPGSDIAVSKSFSSRLFGPRKSDTVELLPLCSTPSSLNSKLHARSQQSPVVKDSSAGDSLIEKKAATSDRLLSWNNSEKSRNDNSPSTSRSAVSKSASSLSTPLKHNGYLPLDIVLLSQNQPLLHRVDENIYEPCPTNETDPNILIV